MRWAEKPRRALTLSHSTFRQPEHGHGGFQLRRRCFQRSRSRGGLLNQRCVLLRDLVHLLHGLPDVFDVVALFSRRIGDVAHDLCHATDLGLDAADGGADVSNVELRTPITVFRTPNVEFYAPKFGFQNFDRRVLNLKHGVRSADCRALSPDDGVHSAGYVEFKASTVEFRTPSTDV